MKNTQHCPVIYAANLIGDTWVILIVRELLLGPARFCELERSLGGISTRTLTAKLKKLEEEDIVRKNELYYSLTSKGVALGASIATIEQFGKKYSKKH